MFSTSMIASSTTTPRAMTSPARIIVLMTVAALVEHEHGRHQRQRDRDQADQRGAPLEEEGDQDQTTSRTPRSSALVRLSMRQLDEGRRPEDRGVDLHAGKTGRISSIASSTPRVTSSVLAHGNFSTISIRPGRR